MAQRVYVVRVSDLSGAEMAEGQGETLTFSLGSANYSIDLTSSEAAQMRAALAPYIDVAQKTTGRGSKQTLRNVPVRDYDPKAVRKWAESNNVPVPSRGRIPSDVVDKFRAAGN